MSWEQTLWVRIILGIFIFLALIACLGFWATLAAFLQNGLRYQRVKANWTALGVLLLIAAVCFAGWLCGHYGWVTF